jgi:hypothetical protein
MSAGDAYHGWILFVRHDSDSGEAAYFGVFSSKESAQRKADAVNSRLEKLGCEIAWAYPVPLDAVRIADEIAEWARSGETAARDERNPVCVEAWPECEDGGYDPRCCRFPKSCSCERPSGETATE